MISVIVPVYKVEKYLRKCVESIQNQTYADLEIILVDDGSPDNCGKICDELATEDKRIKVIHQRNAKQAAARNHGMDYVLGGCTNSENHYIAFVDSDDTIDCRMYETMVEMMESGEYDLAICGHQIVKEDEEPVLCSISTKKDLDESGIWDKVFGHLNNAVWNKLYKASLLDEIRFPIGMIHGEDLIFNIEYISKCQKAVIYSGEFYHYYKRSGSITTGGFSESKLMEITSKDEAKKLVTRYHPAQLENAELYCFRARMNVMRAIYKAGKQNSYRNQIIEYTSFVRENHSKVRAKLKLKESIEFYIHRFFPPLYKFMVRSIR